MSLPFSKRNDDADEPPATAGDDELGLPVGIESPPRDMSDSIDWMGEIAEMAPLGFPRPGHPARHMDVEQAAVQMFQADMHDSGKWGQRQRALLTGLIESASQRRTTLGAELRRAELEITRVESDLDAQRDQLSDQDLKFPHLARHASSLAAVGTVGFGALETITLAPIVGKVMGADDVTATAMAGLVVTGICGAMWMLGSTLHRGLTYEGPKRIRRTYLAAAGGLAAAGLAALATIVGIRVSGGADGMGATSHVLGGGLYAAVQLSVQLLAAAHGWVVNNPRVRELKATARHLTELTTQRDSLEERLEDVETWGESLRDFRVDEWLVGHRSRIAADYSAGVSDFRHNLGLALLREGFDESADTLHLLPLPQFVPPVITDPDDPDDWLTGWIQPL